MRTVRVKKTELLESLRKNRASHRELFLKAQEGFKVKVIEELERRLADARRGIRIKMAVELPEPVDQTNEYDKAIRMMEMEVRDEVELTDDEFSNYVLDQWRWSSQVLGLNSMYTSK